MILSFSKKISQHKQAYFQFIKVDLPTSFVSFIAFWFIYVSVGFYSKITHYYGHAGPERFLF